jgi:hypothetical protein
MPRAWALAVVGNKCDLDDKREVSTEEARQTAKTYGIPFMETSAKRRIKVVRSLRVHACLPAAGGLAIGARQERSWRAAAVGTAGRGVL